MLWELNNSTFNISYNLDLIWTSAHIAKHIAQRGEWHGVIVRQNCCLVNCILEKWETNEKLSLLNIVFSLNIWKFLNIAGNSATSRHQCEEKYPFNNILPQWLEIFLGIAGWDPVFAISTGYMLIPPVFLILNSGIFYKLF